MRYREKIEQDIGQAGAQAVAASGVVPGPSFSSLKDWFAAYGDPKPPPTSGYLTKFEDSPKIYGGTNHHRGVHTTQRDNGICTRYKIHTTRRS